MPFVSNRGASIYWDEEGSGDPLLLITGLGYSSVTWHRMRPALRARYRTIALDNRGVGRSDVPAGPYSIELMASDAIAVLDAARVERAHVFGVSMGGIIAQELALRHPARIAALVFGSTPVVGPHAVRADAETAQMVMARAHMPPADAARAALPFIYDPHTPQVLIEEDLDVRRPWLPQPDAYRAQLQGMLAWESYDRLSEIAAPVLVIHGESDRLVPARNATLIAQRIPGARLVILPQAGHMFTTDQPEAARRVILEFLAEQRGFREDVPARPRA
jgi:pimeloyl-ACP methyl ester carboxylesterase